MNAAFRAVINEHHIKKKNDSLGALIEQAECFSPPHSLNNRELRLAAQQR